MGGLNLKYYNTKSLIPTVLFLSSGIGWVASWLSSIGVVVSVSIVSFVSLFLYVVDNFLWKWEINNVRVLSWLVSIPDLNGRYEGFIRFVHPIEGIEMEKKCFIEVIQTGSKIKVNSYFQTDYNTEKTVSKSLVEAITKNDDDSYDVVFTFRNEGLVQDERFRPHHGTNILKVIKNEDGLMLKGRYYTDRQPQTKGEIDVKFITKTLKQDF